MATHKVFLMCLKEIYARGGRLANIVPTYFEMVIAVEKF
jgi:hypothetical protein